jgi:hypothetical protein
MLPHTGAGNAGLAPEHQPWVGLSRHATARVTSHVAWIFAKQTVRAALVAPKKIPKSASGLAQCGLRQSWRVDLRISRENRGQYTMPSRSAVMAAVARAAHLEVDRPPFLFEDVLVRRLLGSEADALLSYHHTSGAHPLLMGTRLVVTTRARYAENRLADAVSGGIIDTAHAYRRGMLATGGGWLCRWSGHQPYRLCCTRWACPPQALDWRRSGRQEHS